LPGLDYSLMNSTLQLRRSVGLQKCQMVTQSFWFVSVN